MKGRLSFAVLLVAMFQTAGLRADFGPKPTITLSDIPSPVQVVLGDLNNDGRADLVVTSWVPPAKAGQPSDPAQGGVFIFYQKDGRLAAPADRELKVARPCGMCMGDFDADGKTDLAVKDTKKGLHLYLGAEDLAVGHLALNVNDSDRNVAAARLSPSGVMDFLSGPVWRKWHGGDRFQNGYCYGPEVNDNRGSVIADLNQDGQNDLVFCGGGQIRIYYGPLTNLIVRADEVAQFLRINPPRPVQSVAVGDLNGDGRPDILAGLYDSASRSHSLAIYCQGAPLGFDADAGPSVELPDVSGGLYAADVNHDGLTDLVVSDQSRGRILVFVQRKDGLLPRAADHAYQVLRVRCQGLALGDVNGDGFADLVLSDGRSTVSVFLNDGSDDPDRLSGKLVAGSRMEIRPVSATAPVQAAAQAEEAGQGKSQPAKVAAAAADALRELPPPQPGPDYEDPYRMPFYTGTILPTPQQVTYKDEFFPLDNAGLVLGPGLAADGPQVRELRERVERYGGKLQVVDSPAAASSTLVLLGDVASADALLRDRRVPDRQQGYLLLGTRDGQRPVVVLKGRDSLGLLWAISSFNQLVHTRDGRPVVRAAEVADYPESPNRGFIAGNWPDGPGYCVAFKLNKPVFQSAFYRKGHEDWRAPLPEEVRGDLRAYGQRLTPLGIEWYAGASPIRGTQKIRSGNEDDLKVVLDWACAAEEAGGHLCLKYDDSRFPISPDDMQKFGSAREADVHLLAWVHARLQQRYPKARILFCPPFYWGPNSPALYPEPRDDYLYALGKRLPPEIEIFWTGPSVKSGSVTPEMVAWFTERIGRKPVYWQNGFGAPHMFLYHYATDPIRAYPEWLYDGFLGQVDSYMLNCSMPGYAAAVATCADYCWNPKAYDPQRSIREAVIKLVGPETYPALVALNRALSYFDPFGLRRTPGAAQKLPEMAQKLPAVHAAWEEVQRRNVRAVDTWTGMKRHVDQVAKFYDQLRRLPNLAAYRQDAAETQKLAQREVGFSEKKGVFLSPYEFVGGAGPAFYANRCERRLATWIYGSQTANPKMEGSFPVEPFPPSCDYELVVSGQDDDAESQCRIRIWVNETKIFDGENPLARFGWSRHTFRIPAASLLRQSRLRIENAEDTGRAGGPPFFMLNYAVVRPAK